MKYSAIKYHTSGGIRLAMSNLWYCDECSVADIHDAVEDAQNAQELVKYLNNLKLLHTFTLDRETPAKIRLRTVDAWGNVEFFEVVK